MVDRQTDGRTAAGSGVNTATLGAVGSGELKTDYFTKFLRFIPSHFQ